MGAESAETGARAIPRLLWAAAACVFFVALYRSTLLPGVELGDSPSFQTMAGSPVITPRDGYPLYYAVAGVAVWLTGAEPARALNLASAVTAGLACGLVALVGAQLTGSAIAGAAAAFLLGASYTFWSQAIIAEVYALHVVLIALTLLLLLRWERRPTLPRLLGFFAGYALSFGNHLSMILLLPAYAGFLLARAPGGWRSMLQARVVALAAGAAAAGAAQYLWNLRALWVWPSPLPGPAAALETFWFDVTKADWRDTMVLRVPVSMAWERLQMYGFDVRQNFGAVGAALAVAGAWATARRRPDRFLLLAAIYAATLLFALGYNVGDSHVFFLPSHLMLALLGAAGAASLDRASGLRGLAAGAAILLAVARIYQDYPALDRSADHRPRELLDAVTAGINDGGSLLLTDLNWQVQNGLTYYGSRVRPDLLHARLADVLLYAPALVRDNMEIGRQVIVAGHAKATLERAYGPVFEFEPEPQTPPRLSALADALPPGTAYALTVLRPSREFTLDLEDLSRAVARLTGGARSALPEADYMAIVGQVGRPPLIERGAARPFRVAGTLDGIPVQVRMDSWLAFDTIRRMGFGHVIANRRHTLIVERGVSFAAFGPDGAPLRTAYLAGIFEPPPRFLVRFTPPA